MVSSLNYLVLDSSKDKDGSLFYFAKESKIHGNVLSCSTDDKIRITELTFNTFSKEDYLIWKSQLNQIGFKSSGVHKGSISDIIESEDFEKGKIIIATAIRNNKDEGFFTSLLF